VNAVNLDHEAALVPTWRDLQGERSLAVEPVPHGAIGLELDEVAAPFQPPDSAVQEAIFGRFDVRIIARCFPEFEKELPRDLSLA
jgi:hypothetical protein